MWQASNHWEEKGTWWESLSMHPYRGKVHTYRNSDGLSTRPYHLNTNSDIVDVTVSTYLQRFRRSIYDTRWPGYPHFLIRHHTRRPQGPPASRTHYRRGSWVSFRHTSYFWSISLKGTPKWPVQTVLYWCRLTVAGIIPPWSPKLCWGISGLGRRCFGSIALMGSFWTGPPCLFS